jgi:DNA polymerase-3 subunit delta
VDPAQFLLQLQKSRPAAGYLFLGNELFSRDACRKALLEAALPPEDREAGLVQYDLSETTLDAVLEDARTLSLFAGARLIIAYNAEALLLRARDTDDAEQAELSRDRQGADDPFRGYFRNPTPGAVILIEALRFDWDDRDESKKLERLAKYFSAVPVTVEMRRLDPRAALEGARRLARQHQLAIGDPLLAELAEALGHDMARIANEISKLALYAGGGKEITRDDLAALVPEARTSGLFELTDALAARDRTRALEILDTLTRMDVYLPLQISFLAGVFRYALAVKQAGVRNAGEVNRLFQRLGLPVWPARAQQALETANRFTRAQLERAMVLLFETDRDLRRDRPDDRIVMERLVWTLTQPAPRSAAR